MSERQYVVAGFAVPERLEDLHTLLAQVAEEHQDVAPADLMLFETAVIEIAANVVEHGGEGTTWTFVLAVTTTQLRGTLADNGTRFDGELDAALPDDPLAESGRGLSLARSTLDELTYERVGDTNRWLMVRTRTGPDD